MHPGKAVVLDQVSLVLKPHFWSTPQTLLRAISFDVAPGQSCALLGANGAGKTTLLRIVLGLFRPTSGSGSVDGEPLGSPASRRRLGFLPERPALPLEMTPHEFVTFAAKQSGWSSWDARAAAKDALARLGVGAAQHRRMRSFSKGMLQRVGLAQAIVHKPHVLMLDEPLSGLDPPARRDVRLLLQQERARGAAILFSTHILSDVISTCDRAAVLVQGCLAHFAAPYQLLEHAQAAQGIAEVEIVARGLTLEVATSLAAHHHARVVTDYESELRFVAPGLAPSTALLGALHAHGATVLRVEQDTRLLETLLQSVPTPQEVA